MIKAITFDLDNTLINFMKMKKISSNATAKAMVRAGLKMDVKTAKKELFEDFIKDIEGEHVFQDFLKKHNQLTDKILASALNAYLVTKYKFMKPYPKVKKTLLKLKEKGLKFGMITDAPRLKAYQRLDMIGLTDFFDIIIGFEDTYKLKPNQVPFEKALKQLKVKAEETLHVGDYMERDILGAKKMGMKTALSRYGHNHLGKEVEADYVLDKFEDLIEILESFG